MSRNTPTHRPARERGSALMAAILLVTVMAALSFAMMATSVQDRQRTKASTDLTQASYLAEVGVHRAIVDLDTGGAGNIGSEETPIPFSGGNYWASSVDNGDESYTITSRAVLEGEHLAVEVIVAPVRSSLFVKGMFGDLDVDLNGTVFTDSFDSEFGTYASQALKTHHKTGLTYALPDGSLGSNAKISICGTCNILGDATPGPKHTVAIGGTSVYIHGSTAPASEVNELAPVTYSPPIGSSGSISASNGNLDLNAGTHRYDDIKLAGSATVTVRGDVTLYVDGDVSVTAMGMIILEPGASLTLYHGAGNFSLSGQGLWNKDGIARSFVLRSASSDTVKFTGHSGFYGAIYAPSATLKPSGTTELYGSFVGQTIDFVGTANFHFDEALSRDADLSTIGNLEVISWRRVSFANPTQATLPGGEEKIEGDPIGSPYPR